LLRIGIAVKVTSTWLSGAPVRAAMKLRMAARKAASARKAGSSPPGTASAMEPDTFAGTCVTVVVRVDVSLVLETDVVEDVALVLVSVTVPVVTVMVVAVVLVAVMLVPVMLVPVMLESVTLV
jgi:hypothetical protein